MTGDGGFRTVHRVLLLLDCLADAEDGAPIRELSRRLDIPKSTVQRLLAYLKEEGLVHQHPHTSSYSLSASIYRFVGKIQAKMDLGRQALPVMRQIRDQSRQSVALMVREGNDRVCVESLDGLEPLRGFFRLGDRPPVYTGASGKVLMAYLPEDEVESIIAQTGLKPQTPFTITDRATLMQELQKIRRLGFAISNQERYVGLCAIAAPIRNYTGDVVAAVTVAGASATLVGESLQAVVPMVLEGAAGISKRLGCPDGGE